MTTISNVKVYDLEESVNACRYAMFTSIPDKIDFNKSLERAKKLAKCPTNSGECNFLSGIRVSFDLKYPQYLSPELQRYHWVDIVTSQSKMHSLTKMDLGKCFNKYVSSTLVNMLDKLIAEYNIAPIYKKYDLWMKILSNCPLGLELTMRISTNYLQLRTIYHQRKHHKLKEDWGEFCKFIESLPYAKEFITI